MHVTLVHVHVNPEQVDAFIKASQKNHQGSRAEPGNIRFDVLQQEEDPTHFIIYEVFRSAEDAAAHKETKHYMTWRDTVADWMASPRRGAQYRVYCPSEEDQW